MCTITTEAISGAEVGVLNGGVSHEVDLNLQLTLFSPKGRSVIIIPVGQNFCCRIFSFASKAFFTFPFVIITPIPPSIHPSTKQKCSSTESIEQHKRQWQPQQQQFAVTPRLPSQRDPVPEDKNSPWLAPPPKWTITWTDNSNNNNSNMKTPTHH